MTSLPFSLPLNLPAVVGMAAASNNPVTPAPTAVTMSTFSKVALLRDRAGPFQARFSTPILPTSWTIWAVVIVRWDSRATACDGQPCANSYAYFITMRDGCATALTMVFDMGAFDDVWNRCAPADQPPP